MYQKNDFNECLYRDNVLCDRDNCSVSCYFHPVNEVERTPFLEEIKEMEKTPFNTVDCTKQITIEDILYGKDKKA